MSDRSVVAYEDDILVFSKNEKDHIDDVRIVLELLRKNNLFAKLKKCHFHVDRVEFCGTDISTEGVHIAVSKLQPFLSLPIPWNVKDVQTSHETDMPKESRVGKVEEDRSAYGFHELKVPKSALLVKTMRRAGREPPLRSREKNHPLLKNQSGKNATGTIKSPLQRRIRENFGAEDKVVIQRARQGSQRRWLNQFNGVWMYGNEGRVNALKVLKPDILRHHHDDPTAGHVGQKNMLATMTCLYWWPDLRGEVLQYVNSGESF